MALRPILQATALQRSRRPKTTEVITRGGVCRASRGFNEAVVRDDAEDLEVRRAGLL